MSNLARTVLLTVAVLGVTSCGSTAATSTTQTTTATTTATTSEPPFDTCRFWSAEKVGERNITELRNIDCQEAKGVLLRLRGKRAAIPMSCRKSFRRQGWLIRNSSAALTSVWSQYKRGQQSFVYQRPQAVGDNEPWCYEDRASNEALRNP